MTLTAPTPIETTAKSPLGDAVPLTRKPFVPSPLNRRTKVGLGSWFARRDHARDGSQ